MDIWNYLVSYFQLDSISGATTFPELLQAFFVCIFAIVVVTVVCRTIFSLMATFSKLGK